MGKETISQGLPMHIRWDCRGHVRAAFFLRRLGRSIGIALPVRTAGGHFELIEVGLEGCNVFQQGEVDQPST